MDKSGKLEIFTSVDTIGGAGCSMDIHKSGKFIFVVNYWDGILVSINLDNDN